MESRWTRRKSSAGPSWPVTAGGKVIRADRLYVPSKPQGLGKPPVCGVEAPLGAEPAAAHSLAGIPGSTA